jgi:thioredoxin reductase (NADPH)
MILGGSYSAFDWAATLAPLARSVMLVHRREKFRAYHGLLREVLGIPVQVLTSAEVVAALGFTADIGLLQAWSLRTAERRIVVDTTMASSLDRVHAAGDIAAYRGKVRLLSVGFGETSTAVNNAAAATHPAAGLFPGHSSDVPESVADAC